MAGALGPAAASAAPATASRTHRAHCPPSGGRVVASNRVVRVYVPKSQSSTPTATPAVAAGVLRTRVEACVIRTGKRMTLFVPPARRGGFHSVSDFALGGAIVAFQENSSGIDGGTSTLLVADVAHTRVVRRLPGGHFGNAGLLSSAQVTDLVVAPSGAVAWILSSSQRGSPNMFSVRAAGRRSAMVVLDESPDILGQSLSLAGTTLSWQHGRSLRTAPLPSA